jgi:hypothetical protein
MTRQTCQFTTLPFRSTVEHYENMLELVLNFFLVTPLRNVLVFSKVILPSSSILATCQSYCCCITAVPACCLITSERAFSSVLRNICLLVNWGSNPFPAPFTLLEQLKIRERKDAMG